MTFLSKNLVLSLVRNTENAPRLCFQNIVSSSNISATSELTSGSTTFPATNMANPATAFGWEAAGTADQTITILNNAANPIDYIGIARHNLGQAGLEIRVRFDAATVLDWQAVSDTQALLYLFEEAVPTTVYIDIRGVSNAAKIAVVYVGQSLRFERNIYVGHTPITYGRQRQAINGVSQAGEFLGQVVLNETLATTVDVQNLTPLWYRNELDPFFAMNPRKPIFWAWRPATYPNEVAYAWVEGSPQVSNQRSNGMMQTSFNLRGIA